MFIKETISYIFFVSIGIFYMFFSFFWISLENLTDRLRNKHPDEWIKFGSLRFTYKFWNWYTSFRVLGDLNKFTGYNTGSKKSYILLYQFIKSGYKELNDSEIEKLIKKVKTFFICLFLPLIIIISYIIYIIFLLLK